MVDNGIRCSICLSWICIRPDHCQLPIGYPVAPSLAQIPTPLSLLQEQEARVAAEVQTVIDEIIEQLRKYYVHGRSLDFDLKRHPSDAAWPILQQRFSEKGWHLIHKSDDYDQRTIYSIKARQGSE